MKNKGLSIIVLLAFLFTSGCFLFKKDEAKGNNPAVTQAEEKAGLNITLPKTMNGMINDKGILIKIIPTRRNIRTSLTPGGAQNQTAVNYFQPYFVFNIAKDGNNNWYQISNYQTGENMLGWVYESDIQRWDWTLGLRYGQWDNKGMPIKNTTLPRLYIYPTYEALCKAIESGKNEGYIAEYFHSNDDITKIPLMAWPCVQFKEFKTTGGNVYNTYQIFCLGGFGEGGNEAGLQPISGSEILSEEQRQEEIQTIRRSIETLEIVFVIDSTSSMAQWIEETKKSVIRIFEQVKKLGMRVKLRFGLVEYHDYVNGLYFENGKVYKIYSLTEDHQKFLNSVNPVKSADTSSEDYPEAVFDGLDAAINEINWEQTNLSERIIILLGNDGSHPANSPKNPKKLTMEGIVAQAIKPEKHIRIFSLIVPTRASSELFEIHKRQFSFLAEKTNEKLGKKLDGKPIDVCFSLDKHLEVVPVIKSIADIGYESTVIKTGIVDAVVRGDLNANDDGTVTRKNNVLANLKDEEITDVIKFVKNASGYDLSSLRPGETIPCLGWITDQSLNSKILLVEREVYISQIEASYLHSEYSTMLTMLLNPKSMRKSFGEALDTRLGEDESLANIISFFSEKNNDFLTAQEFYKSLGIPCKPNSILSFTLSEIENDTISEGVKQNLINTVRGVCTPGINNSLNNNFRLMGSDPFQLGWLQEKFLL